VGGGVDEDQVHGHEGEAERDVPRQVERRQDNSHTPRMLIQKAETFVRTRRLPPIVELKNSTNLPCACSSYWWIM
jgi:hypothetical protein